jgi:hypothetical protein
MYVIILMTRPWAGPASEVDEATLAIVDLFLLVYVQAPELAVRADADGLDVLVEAMGDQA